MRFGLKHVSPLRYPGGKSSLATFLAATIESIGLSGCRYYEPFAGGAGAGLNLLMSGVASELHLNDFDPCITAFWRAVLTESDRFEEAILTVPITVEEWYRQCEIVKQRDSSNTFGLGFATFFLNRCNRSGVIKGAAPIGGYSQEGLWKIDARFYRERLAERVRTIVGFRDAICITTMEAKDFLEARVIRKGETNAFVYLDPPYYSKGSRLYMNAYTDSDHRNLAKYIKGWQTVPWLVSYDNCEFIKELYTSCNIYSNTVQYSLQRKQVVQELLIAPSYVRLQEVINLFGGRNSTESEGAPYGIQ